MAYVGNPIDTQNTFQSLVGKRFSGDGSTTDFTLDVAPGSTLDIEVFVGNVRQDPNSAYTVSGTTLSFTGAPPSGTNNIYVVHQAKSVGTIDVPALGVSTASIQADAITEAKIADDAVESEHLNDNIISGQTELASAPDSTDELLISDGGTLKRIDVSLIGGTSDVAFSAYMNSNTSINHEATTKLEFDAEVFDVGSCFDTSNYRFTVPTGKGGYYHIGYSVNYESSANSTVLIGWTKVYKNGSRISYGENALEFYQNNTNNPTRNVQTAKSFIINLSASDYIELYGQVGHSSGSSINANLYYSNFWGYKLIT